MSESSIALALLALLCVAALLYGLPTYIAFRRRHPNRWLILIANAALGGTVIGWLAVLVWALRVAHVSDRSGQSNGGQSGLNLFADDARVIRVEHVVPQVVEVQVPAPSRRPALDLASAAHRLDVLDRLHLYGYVAESEYTALRAGLLRQL